MHTCLEVDIQSRQAQSRFHIHEPQFHSKKL